MRGSVALIAALAATQLSLSYGPHPDYGIEGPQKDGLLASIKRASSEPSVIAANLGQHPIVVLSVQEKGPKYDVSINGKYIFTHAGNDARMRQKSLHVHIRGDEAHSFQLNEYGVDKPWFGQEQIIDLNSGELYPLDTPPHRLRQVLAEMSHLESIALERAARTRTVIENRQRNNLQVPEDRPSS